MIKIETKEYAQVHQIHSSYKCIGREKTKTIRYKTFHCYGADTQLNHYYIMHYTTTPV